MRNLTMKQKMLLKQWAKAYYTKMKGNDWLTVQTLTPAQYEELEKINDTEILYNNVERFLYDYREELDKIII